MTQMIWQVEEAFHVFPDMAGDEINARLEEDPFAFCSVVEATHYEQKSEAREELAKKTSKAVVDGMFCACRFSPFRREKVRSQRMNRSRENGVFMYR